MAYGGVAEPLVVSIVFAVIAAINELPFGQQFAARLRDNWEVLGNHNFPLPVD